jgi:hypothetical protein
MSYIEAGEVLMHGDIDEFRTPCYPFLFAIGNVFMPGHSDKFVVIAQIIVFFLSIVPFNRIMQYNLDNHDIVCAVSINNALQRFYENRTLGIVF